ncbi:MAG TPA: iron-containing redox enzyme family protein [Actinomycetales bacterium]|nr:iron-containing redox enzyme family protein [Actinomycetales bacterium]
MRGHPRGPLSAAVVHLLSGDDDAAPGELPVLAKSAVATSHDLVADDDVQLALHLLYELHYSGNACTPTPSGGRDWEWDPHLLATRGALERAFEEQLRDAHAWEVPDDPADVPALLFSMAAASGGAGPQAVGARRRPGSIASFVARQATLAQLREMLVLRSPYQLKEADPQTFAIPRLRGRAKAALVEIQSDEYGGGRSERMHQELFARTMRSVQLDDRPNHYLDSVPAVVLAGVNAISMFALNRRLRGALCGHLAAFEMTSSLPAKRYVSGMQRLGLGRDAWLFFDEHVEADAVHEQIAATDLCGGLLDDEPELAADVLLGAAVCLGLDARVTDHVLSAWTDGRTALRQPLPAGPPGGADGARPSLHLLPVDPTMQSDGPAARAVG